ncbi:MAG: hypothetical protein ONB46_11525 [candidate division KSB1 bacterium]|nr:hypothetical protein [candidate division KSB1 bacterium]MDZ7366626.1 hypothetical protein [candidate division KSB1 bacterium]MDZ7404637.1 hypothetical protein [candidate division KSB1 bacterium]
MNNKKRWLHVVVFAVAMAWVESAVVVDLRTLVDRLEPYQTDPLPFVANLGEVELVREIATLIMLAAVGCLAGHSRQTKWGYAFLAFGVWDIFYYVFLKIIVGWPRSIWDWDILFLLPLPWWGPVIAPVTIAAMMIIFGILITQFNPPAHPIWPSRRAWIFGLSGAVLALLVFMSDAIRSIGGGVEAIRTTLPTWFNWPVFLIALALMAVPIISASRQIWNGGSTTKKRSFIPTKTTLGAQTFLLLLLYKIISRDT